MGIGRLFPTPFWAAIDAYRRDEVLTFYLLVGKHSPRVHVAHVVLDGLIEEPQTTGRFGPTTAARMKPGAIAAAYLALARQHRSAWTHEVDLRPFCEKF